MELGLVDPDQFYADLDIACIPLLTEFGTKVFPNAILEAMRCGTPLLTTRHATLVELLGDSPPFPLLTEVTPRAIAEAIQQMRQLDPETISEYLKHRYAKMDYETVKQRWKQLITELFV